MAYQIIQGDNRTVLKQYPDNHFDSIVTDPPYGIDFLGKAWDANTGALETYQECLRVLKPGGHILAFSAARTYHHLAVTLEQAGFEIRDQIMWIYSSGFPKSQDIGRQLHKRLHGKPDKQRFDPAIMIRHKNPNPNVRDKTGNSLYQGGQQKADTGVYEHPETGRFYRVLPDINGDRLAKSHEGEGYGVVYEEIIEVDNEWSGWGTALKPAHEPVCLARKPISEKNIADNCQRWGTGAVNIDATRIPYGSDSDRPGSNNVGNDGTTFGNFNPEKTDKDISVEGGWDPNEQGRFPANVIGEIPAYQKYFYCPKVSAKERHIGYNDATVIGSTHPDDVRKHPLWDPSIGTNPARLKQKIIDSGQYQGNNHPTVKPIELMKYLIRLITPAGGHVLDPFNGSGSTGCAAVELGYEYTGIELDPRYVEIAEKRIEAWNQNTTTYGALFVEC